MCQNVVFLKGSQTLGSDGLGSDGVGTELLRLFGWCPLANPNIPVPLRDLRNKLAQESRECP